ncbi:predicted protein [Histoplasma capsulatum H143]|uniref:Uncharacterized protein n=1 Tax=Ajellomyces capsulatus (strain H143) TaxID=544712 RepID=C6HFR4_AJECH|nr:predicted protein [Histoplasma capsulatum H143]
MRLSCTFLQQRQSGYELTMVNMSSDEYLGLRNRASTLVCVFDHQMQQPSALRPFPKRPPIGPQSARLHPPKGKPNRLTLSKPSPPSIHLFISLSPYLLVSSSLHFFVSPYLSHSHPHSLSLLLLLPISIARSPVSPPSSFASSPPPTSPSNFRTLHHLAPLDRPLSHRSSQPQSLRCQPCTLAAQKTGDCT